VIFNQFFNLCIIVRIDKLNRTYRVDIKENYNKILNAVIL